MPFNQIFVLTVVGKNDSCHFLYSLFVNTGTVVQTAPLRRRDRFKKLKNLYVAQFFTHNRNSNLWYVLPLCGIFLVTVTYAKFVCAFNSSRGVNLYWRLTMPSKQALSGVLLGPFWIISTNQLRDLAAIFVPIFLSNGVGEPPCCIWPGISVRMVLKVISWNGTFTTFWWHILWLICSYPFDTTELKNSIIYSWKYD